MYIFFPQLPLEVRRGGAGRGATTTYRGRRAGMEGMGVIWCVVLHLFALDLLVRFLPVLVVGPPVGPRGIAII